MRNRKVLVLILACLAACSEEARTVGPAVPQTRPVSDSDPRIPVYQDNLYQVAQGGRYFAWYGCSRCHRDGAPDPLDLAARPLRHGGGFAQVFGAIADGHPRQAYGARVPVEQLWQLTAYVRDLPRHSPEKRRRIVLDQSAEPQGSNWSGPQ